MMEPSGCNSFDISQHRSEGGDTADLLLYCPTAATQAFLSTSNFQEYKGRV